MRRAGAHRHSPYPAKQADGTFRGTFTLKSGAVHAMNIARVPAAESKPAAQALPAGAIVAPVHGPREGTKCKRSCDKDLAYKVNVAGESVRSDVLNFPIEPGKSRDTTLFDGRVLTLPNCRAEAPERLRMGDRDLEVAPIACTGTWKNLQSGSSDQAVHKYWYAPELRDVARRTVLTCLQGGTCADVEYVLDSAGREVRTGRGSKAWQRGRCAPESARISNRRDP